MNFFEHQDRSRRQTRWLLLLFAIAVLAVVAVVNVVLLLTLGFVSPLDDAPLLSAANLRANSSMLLFGAIGTGLLIGLASLSRILQLRGGGGDVARSLGGTLVDPDSRDPLRRRLVNVVEEISLAAGVPVPQIFVLEQEPGINAFAAGYSPSDAAVAVTRGTLETLNRSELQGVIAHEFSHILNGDMRLNIKLMGALFGILVLSLIGRRVLLHSGALGRSRNSGPILALAIALVVIGYVGLFFGRVIKSAVSRQREYLADASAVQFTRDPGSIAGALKKIAVHGNHSYLQADSEEVGHMLFGSGQQARLLATHPPLLQRIARVEPGFTEDDLQVVAERLKRDEQRQKKAAAQEEQRREQREQGPRMPLDAQSIIDQIGNPDMQQILIAAALAESLPGDAAAAARAVESAPYGLLYSLLMAEDTARTAQLRAIEKSMGAQAADAVNELVKLNGVLEPTQRLPVLEIALPALHRQPAEVLQRMLTAIDAMIRVDGTVDVFEYLLARLVRQYLWESANPGKVRLAGNRSLSQRRPEVRDVLAVMAWHGQRDDPVAALKAYRLAVGEALGEIPEALPAPLTESADWITPLDRSLDRLDELTAAGKEKLLRALALCVRFDDQLIPVEVELLRAVCSALHVPIPALVASAQR